VWELRKQTDQTGDSKDHLPHCVLKGLTTVYDLKGQDHFNFTILLGAAEKILLKMRKW
jgi:hypothetical protein